MSRRKRISSLAASAIVMATLLSAPPEERRPLPHKVQFVTAAAPPSRPTRPAA